MKFKFKLGSHWHGLGVRSLRRAGRTTLLPALLQVLSESRARSRYASMTNQLSTTGTLSAFKLA